MVRKQMFASLLPYLPKSAKESDVFELPWENELQEKISDEEFAETLLEIEKQKEFWRQQDIKKGLT